jgi:hypothetical protein
MTGLRLQPGVSIEFLVRTDWQDAADKARAADSGQRSSRAKSLPLNQAVTAKHTWHGFLSSRLESWTAPSRNACSLRFHKRIAPLEESGRVDARIHLVRIRSGAFDV